MNLLHLYLQGKEKLQRVEVKKGNQEKKNMILRKKK
jgi:hypothetical protein